MSKYSSLKIFNNRMMRNSPPDAINMIDEGSIDLADS
jgi:hypothetical protein